MAVSQAPRHLSNQAPKHLSALPLITSYFLLITYYSLPRSANYSPLSILHSLNRTYVLHYICRTTLPWPTCTSTTAYPSPPSNPGASRTAQTWSPFGDRHPPPPGGSPQAHNGDPPATQSGPFNPFCFSTHPHISPKTTQPSPYTPLQNTSWVAQKSTLASATRPRPRRPTPVIWFFLLLPDHQGTHYFLLR